jgi:hypothetical protein
MSSSEEICKFLETAPRFKSSNIKPTTTKDRQTLRNIIREYSQKNALNNKQIQDAKKKCKRICPCCGEIVVQLHAAHIGKPRSKIIDSVLDSHPEETNILELIRLFHLADKDTELVIVCIKCNRRIEQETNSSSALVSLPDTHTSDSVAMNLQHIDLSINLIHNSAILMLKVLEITRI